MHIYVYKITNLINDKEYIGVHATDNLDDGYLGSGRAIVAAIHKHGKQAFTKEILRYFDSIEEAYRNERELVTEEYVKSDSTYNMTAGGKIPPSRAGSTVKPSTIEKLKAWQATDEAKVIARSSGMNGWQRKGHWTADEISRRTATRKANDSYSRDMSACHTTDAIARRTETRRIKGVKYNTLNCNSAESRFKREKTKVLKKITGIVEHYGMEFDLDLLKQARRERVSYLSDKTLARYITDDDISRLTYPHETT